jgi:hypothetical protein
MENKLNNYENELHIYNWNQNEEALGFGNFGVVYKGTKKNKLTN